MLYWIDEVSTTQKIVNRFSSIVQFSNKLKARKVLNRVTKQKTIILRVIDHQNMVRTVHIHKQHLKL